MKNPFAAREPRAAFEISAEAVMQIPSMQLGS